MELELAGQHLPLPRDTSMLMLAAALGLGLVLCFFIALPFIPALVWALTLTVLFAPVETILRRRLKRPAFSVSLSLIIAAVIVVAPVVIVSKALLNEAINSIGLIESLFSADNWDELENRYHWIPQLLEWTIGHLGPEQMLESLRARLSHWSGSLLQASASGVFNLLLTFYFLFYLLRDRAQLLAALERMLPLHADEFSQLVASIVRTIFASVYGTLAVACLQGFLGGLMFWWLGLPSPIFWGIIMGLLAIVPFLGAFVVWVPAALVLALNGQFLSAFALAAWGFVVVGLVDNLIYPILVGRQLAMHSMFSFIAIFGGLVLFGAHGIVLGPIILAASLALLEIWRSRLDAAHTQEQSSTPADA